MNGHNGNGNVGRGRAAALIGASAALALVTGFGYGMASAALDEAGAAKDLASLASPEPVRAPHDFRYTGGYSAAIKASGARRQVADETLESTVPDQNVALSERAGSLSITGGVLKKTGDATDLDEAGLYGTNAVAIAVGANATTTIRNAALTSSAIGAHGLFATDAGSILIDKTSIGTTANDSRGLDATYRGTILGGNLAVDTIGLHSPAIGTGRSGGSISLSKASLHTAGAESPLLYATGDIQLNSVQGEATGSSMATLEGDSTILVNSSKLTSAFKGQATDAPAANGVLLHGSPNGDAQVSDGGHATFQAADSMLDASIRSGAMFYATDTDATIVLSDTMLDFDSAKAYLLIAAGNETPGWGTAGDNGAHVTMTGRDQELAGDVEVDSISSATLNLMSRSSWTGSTRRPQNVARNAAGEPAGTGAGAGHGITVDIDATSTWVVTADTTVDALHASLGARVVDRSGRRATIVDGKGRVLVKGEGSVTVTVTGGMDDHPEFGDDTELSSRLIDRTPYDDAFGVSSTWTMGADA